MHFSTATGTGLFHNFYSRIKDMLTTCASPVVNLEFPLAFLNSHPISFANVTKFPSHASILIELTRNLQLEKTVNDEESSKEVSISASHFHFGQDLNLHVENRRPTKASVFRSVFRPHSRTLPSGKPKGVLLSHSPLPIVTELTLEGELIISRPPQGCLNREFRP